MLLLSSTHYLIVQAWPHVRYCGDNLAYGDISKSYVNSMSFLCKTKGRVKGMEHGALKRGGGSSKEVKKMKGV